MRSPKPPKRNLNQSPQMREIPRSAVGDPPFQIVPDQFVGIEFRGIGREAANFQAPVFLKNLLGDFPSMRSASVPQKHHRTPQMFEEMPQERSDLRGADIFVVVKPGIEGDPPSTRRDADR